MTRGAPGLWDAGSPGSVTGPGALGRGEPRFCHRSRGSGTPGSPGSVTGAGVKEGGAFRDGLARAFFGGLMLRGEQQEDKDTPEMNTAAA